MEPTLQGDIRGVLSIKPFRKLWQSMAFSSLGDWLGLLATTALAQQLAGGDYAKANFAIAGVFIFRLLPSVILGRRDASNLQILNHRCQSVFVDTHQCSMHRSTNGSGLHH